MTEQNLTLIDPHTVGAYDFDLEKANKDERLDFKFFYSPLEYTPGPDTSKFSLMKKVSEIIGLVDNIPKNGYNQRFEYKFAREADIVGALRKLMSERALVLSFNVENYEEVEHKTRNGSMQLGTLQARWTLFDGETMEKLSFTTLGKGTDNLEKAYYKAVTGCKKYALIVLFQIETNDDPEYQEKQQEKPQEGRTDKNKVNNTNGHVEHEKRSTDENGDARTHQESKGPSKADLVLKYNSIAPAEMDAKTRSQQFNKWYAEMLQKGKTIAEMGAALIYMEKKMNEAKKSEEIANGHQGGHTDGHPGDNENIGK